MERGPDASGGVKPGDIPGALWEESIREAEAYVEANRSQVGPHKMQWPDEVAAVVLAMRDKGASGRMIKTFLKTWRDGAYYRTENTILDFVRKHGRQ